MKRDEYCPRCGGGLTDYACECAPPKPGWTHAKELMDHEMGEPKPEVSAVRERKLQCDGEPVLFIEKAAYDRVCEERDEARTALRFDVDSNSATGWMVKYQRQLAVNETQKKNIEHLLACEAVYRKERDALAAELLEVKRERKQAMAASSEWCRRASALAAQLAEAKSDCEKMAQDLIFCKSNKERLERALSYAKSKYFAPEFIAEIERLERGK